MARNLDISNIYRFTEISGFSVELLTLIGTGVTKVATIPLKVNRIKGLGHPSSWPVYTCCRLPHIIISLNNTRTYQRNECGPATPYGVSVFLTVYMLGNVYTVYTVYVK